jgi:ATP-binding cassette subfamily F protein 3
MQLSQSGEALLLLSPQDEPTAHLDIQAVESLVTCLQGFAGAVLLVSHDQHVIRSLAKEVRARQQRSSG